MPHPDLTPRKGRKPASPQERIIALMTLNKWLDSDDDNYRHENKLDYDTLAAIRDVNQDLERELSRCQNRLHAATFREDMGR